MDLVWVALISGVCAFTGPVLVAIVTHFIRQAEKTAEYARQDAVAEKAASVAADASEAAKQAATMVAKTAADAVEGSRTTNSKLDVIHVLVNSNLTAAMQSELNATMREIVVLQEVLILRGQAGKPVNGGTSELIKVAEARVVELKAKIAERNKRDEAASALEASGPQVAENQAVAIADALAPKLADAADVLVPKLADAITERLPGGDARDAAAQGVSEPPSV